MHVSKGLHVCQHTCVDMLMLVQADRVRLACEDAIVSGAAGGLTATHPVV